jgi:hypothetical protein
LIDIGEIGALRNLEFLVLGNAFNHPLFNLVLLLVDYIYNMEKPLSTLIEGIVI